MLGFVRTNSPTSARHWDGLGYKRIWVTPTRRLVFWDGVSSPYTTKEVENEFSPTLIVLWLEIKFLDPKFGRR